MMIANHIDKFDIIMHISENNGLLLLNGIISYFIVVCVCVCFQLNCHSHSVEIKSSLARKSRETKDREEMPSAALRFVFDKIYTVLYSFAVCCCLIGKT